MYSDIFSRDLGKARQEDFLKEAHIGRLQADAQVEPPKETIYDEAAQAPSNLGGLFQWILSGMKSASQTR